MAADAPMPASTHPSRPTTMTGRDSRSPTGSPQSGSNSVERRRVVIGHSDSTSASARSPSRPTWAANWSAPDRSPAAAPPA